MSSQRSPIPSPSRSPVPQGSVVVVVVEVVVVVVIGSHTQASVLQLNPGGQSISQMPQPWGFVSSPQYATIGPVVVVVVEVVVVVVVVEVVEVVVVVVVGSGSHIHSAVLHVYPGEQSSSQMIQPGIFGSSPQKAPSGSVVEVVGSSTHLQISTSQVYPSSQSSEQIIVLESN